MFGGSTAATSADAKPAGGLFGAKTEAPKPAAGGLFAGGG